MNLDEIAIGETLRRLRVRKGLPLEAVAARANLSPVSVRALEFGRGSTLSTLLKVLKTIDETDFLLEWSKKSNEISPMQSLRESRKLAVHPKRASRR